MSFVLLRSCVSFDVGVIWFIVNIGGVGMSVFIKV